MAGSPSGPKGEIWGTPFYIAPEKVRGHKEDQRSDIYSLGATLYHALAGKPPFDAPTAHEVVKARLENPPPDLGQSRSDLSADTLQVIARMLEPEPFRRYPNYRSLISDLKDLAALKLGPSTTSRLNTSRLSASRMSATSRLSTSRLDPVSSNGSGLRRGTGTPTPGRSSRKIFILAVVILAAAAIGAGVFLARRGETSVPPPATPPATPPAAGPAAPAGVPDTEPKTEAFDTAPQGPLSRLESSLGIFTAPEGHAVIFRPRYRTPPQSLRILGGEEHHVVLELAKPAAAGACLSFYSERWTRNNPFRFRIEADTGAGFQEFVSADRTVQIGGFKVEVIAWLPEGAQRLRFIVEAPPDTGLMIDDMKLSPPAAQAGAPDWAGPLAQVFDAQQAEMFKEGAQLYLDGNAEPAVKKWAELANSLSDKHIGRMWCLVFTGLPLWEQGDAVALQKRLDPLALKDFPAPPGAPPHPGVMPQSIARAMLGQPFAAPPGGWPEWLFALAQFIEGGRFLQQDRIDDGVNKMNGYLNPASAEPAWAYAFQPLALRWKSEAEEWKAWRDKDGGIFRRIETGGGQDVVDELKRRAENPSPGILRAIYANRLERAREAFASAQSADEKRRGEQAELANAGQRLTDLQRLAGDLNFTEMTAQLSGADAQFQTPAGKDAWQGKRKIADVFVRIPGLIDTYARKAPFDGRGVRIPGFVVGAQAEGFALRAPAGGAQRRIPWGQLTPEQFVALASFYVKGAPVLESERGGFYLALAWYSTDKPRIQVRNIVAAALDADPSLRNLAAEILPGEALP